MSEMSSESSMSELSGRQWQKWQQFRQWQKQFCAIEVGGGGDGYLAAAMAAACHDGFASGSGERAKYAAKAAKAAQFGAC